MPFTIKTLIRVGIPRAVGSTVSGVLVALDLSMKKFYHRINLLLHMVGWIILFVYVHLQGRMGPIVLAYVVSFVLFASLIIGYWMSDRIKAYHAFSLGISLAELLSIAAIISFADYSWDVFRLIICLSIMMSIMSTFWYGSVVISTIGIACLLFFEKTISSYEIAGNVVVLVAGGCMSFYKYMNEFHYILGVRAKLDESIFTHYRDMVLPDGDHTFGSYLISKVSEYGKDPVGGDFVSKPIVDIGNRCFTITIGDINGHGVNKSIAATVAMAALRGAARVDPVESQIALHRSLQDMGEDKDGSAWAITVSLCESGKVTWAGKLEYIIHVKRDGSTQHIMTEGVVLGPISSDEFVLNLPVYMLQLEHGETLVISTDGHLYGDELDDQTSVRITYKGPHERDS